MNKHIKHILAISRKEIKSIRRRKYTIFFALIFPVMFLGIYSIAFKSTGTSTLDIAVVNLDSGYTFRWINGSIQESKEVNFGDVFIDILNTTKMGDNSTDKLFNVRIFDNINEARTALINKEVCAIIIVPENFSRINVNTINGTIRSYLIEMAFEHNIPLNSINGSLPEYTPGLNTTIITEGDFSLSDYWTASEIVNGILREFENRIIQKSIDMVESNLDPWMRIDFSTITGSIKISKVMATNIPDWNYFDISVPGLIIFAILSLVTTVSGVILEDVESHKIWRLKLSQLSSSDIIIGNFVAYTVFAEIIAMIFFVVAFALGFHWAGGIQALLTAILFVFISGMATIALGLIIGGVSKNVDMTTLVSLMTYLPISFLIGAFFPISGMPKISIFGRTVPITFLLPWASALSGMKQTLVFGITIDLLIPELIISTVGSILLLIPGIFLYRKIQMRPE